MVDFSKHLHQQPLEGINGVDKGELEAPPWESEARAVAVEESPLEPPFLPDHKGLSLQDFDGVSPVCFLTGVAGSGKTWKVREYIRRDPQFGVLAATTGVAATNLGPGVPTIHSLLGFGNTQGAEDAYNSGNMLRKLRQLADQGFRWIIIDEASMLHYKVLDYIVLALDDYNQTYEGSERGVLGLMLTGDMCQLSPVPDRLIGEGGKYVTSKAGKEIPEPTPWLFKAECWDRFEKNTITLTEVRRQTDRVFIDALNAIRAGKAKEGTALLEKAGVTFKHLLNNNFDGTTIVATNEEVDRFNSSSLLKVEGEKFQLSSTRWCAKQYPPSEWKNIPEKGNFKVGALVMILQNHQPGVGGGPRMYVNGDLGHVVGMIRESSIEDLEAQAVTFAPDTGEIKAVEIQLLRTGEKVFISKVTRPTYQLNEPDMDYIPPGPNKEKIRKDRVPGMTRRVWILGEIEYFPLRLAYATTVHKSQGLSLDRVQINPKAYFFGHPQMAYVALSRARNAEGLVIVGGAKALEGKINTDPILERWM